MTSTNSKSYIYAITAILFWSTAASAFKIGLKDLDFIQLLFFSSAIAVLILFFILLFQRKLTETVSISARLYLQSALVGLLNPFGYYMILLKAYSILPAQLAQPLNYTWPIMLVLLSVPLLNQKVTAKSLFAILISFTGVFFISAKGNVLNYQLDEPFGVFLASGSSVVWALFWIFNVKDKRNEISKLFLNFVFGTIYIAVAMFFFSSFNVVKINGLLASVYIGFFEMGFTFVLWLKAMQLATSNAKISNLVFISPFISLILIHFVLGESIFFTTIIGLILIILGIAVQQINFSKK